MKKTYRIGCSGYYYSNWKNKFYPQGVAAKNWLAYYSSQFNTVELNGTFYKVPKPDTLKRYAEVTPANFRFSVKVNKFITHNLKLKNCAAVVEEFQDLVIRNLGKKLSCFLFQMPPSFVYNDENLQRLLSAVPHNKENVVELRHISWWNDTVKKELAKAKITFCNIDSPGFDTYILQTTSLFYFRFHGNPQMFVSQYSEEQLRAFAENIPDTCSKVFVYFNNTTFEAGYTNARELKQILESH